MAGGASLSVRIEADGGVVPALIRLTASNHQILFYLFRLLSIRREMQLLAFPSQWIQCCDPSANATRRPRLGFQLPALVSATTLSKDASPNPASGAWTLHAARSVRTICRAPNTEMQPNRAPECLHQPK